MSYVRHPNFVNSYVCAYCGEDAETVDHFLPQKTVRLLEDDPHWYRHLERLMFTLPACRQCNVVANDRFYWSFLDKQHAIRLSYRTRYAKVLRRPDWDEEEINEMGFELRAHIRKNMLERVILEMRLSYRPPQPVDPLEKSSERKAKRAYLLRQAA